jgi:heptosyltransferase-2
MRNILVVNVNWLGDAIFSLPVFKALKAAYPGARISCLAVPRVREVLELSADIDEILIYDEEGKHRMPWSKLNLIMQLRRQNFDAAFLLHRSLTRALLVFLAGIPRRIGYDEKGRGIFLTHKVPPSRGWIHRADHYLKVIEAFGIAAEDRSIELNVPAVAQTELDMLLKNYSIGEKDFLVAVNAGGNWDLKRWPQENFSRLIRQLAQDNSIKVIIPGAPSDKRSADAIASASGAGVIVLAGATDLKQLAALFKRVDLVISADTGPMHLAGGVGAKVIALFGPTRPEVTGPRGKGKFFLLQNDVGCNREPCYNLACPDNVCMQSITVEDVLKVVERVRGQG